MLETIIELTVRAIAWLFMEIIIGYICYGLGKGILKTITFGHHPKPDANKRYIQLLGACILIAPLVIYTIYIFSHR